MSQNGHFCTSFHSVRGRKTNLYVKNHNTIFTDIKVRNCPVKEQKEGAQFTYKILSGTPPEDRSTIIGYNIYDMFSPETNKINHSHNNVSPYKKKHR